MTTRTVERSDEWEAIPFSGGYAGLHELADEEFSGKVVAGPTRLFMLRGSVVGVLGGSIEDFEDMDGTAREAPHPALPLLAVMQEVSDEVRAKYYSEDTPMSEVNRTLEDGSFTGYIELSENVLSGDYYQVYHQGRSMSVAWVGAAERLITDDEAFGQADDEVGIYSVHPADIEIVDVPEPADSGGVGAGGVTTSDTAESPSTGADAAPTAAGADGSETTEFADSTPDESTVDAGASTDTSAGSSEATESTTDAGATSTDEPVTSESSSSEANADSRASTPSSESSGQQPNTSGAGTAQRGGDAGRQQPQGDATEQPSDASARDDRSDATQQPGRQPADGSNDARQPDQQAGRAASGGQPSSEQRPQGGGGRSSDAGQRSSSHSAGGHAAGGRDASGGGDLAADDLETRSLPSLDPERTASGQPSQRAGGGGGRQQGTGQSNQRRQGGRSGQQQPGASSQSPPQASESAGADSAHSQPAQNDAGTADAESQPPAEPAQREPDAGQTADAQPDEEPTPAQSEPQTSETDDPTPSQQEPPAEAEASSDAADAQRPADEADAPQPETAEPETAEAGTGETDTAEADAPAAETKEAVAEQVEEVEELQSELGNLEGERDEIAEERDRMEDELAEAREELERLRGRLDDAVGEARDAEVRLSPREAIEETNLFVRYDSRGEATLENAHAGNAERAAVDENLRLEYHTSFEAEDAAVDGRPFDDFLTDTIQYRFVDWLVRQLLYEIRDTGHGSEMADLYDALPRVDRVELNGLVTVTYTENGTENRSQEGFDIVVRDRMGNPLIVANINDSRDPATDEMMTDLITRGERVGESNDTLAGAFLVTKSFFAPESLETAEQATSGGLLSRDKHKSFVNLSRKGGYHLCLVEARNREFHLTVPEL